MNASTFTNDHLKNMLNSIHYSINYDKKGACNFLELLFNHNFTPQITLPSRVNEISATLIGNIFVNNPSFKYLSGKMTTSISDHLPHLSKEAI